MDAEEKLASTKEKLAQAQSALAAFEAVGSSDSESSLATPRESEEDDCEEDESAPEDSSAQDNETEEVRDDPWQGDCDQLQPSDEGMENTTLHVDEDLDDRGVGKVTDELYDEHLNSDLCECSMTFSSTSYIYS